MKGPALFAAGLALLAAAVITVAALVSESLPAGPVTPVFDKQACAYCQMHLGEPQFAAQLQTQAGDVLFFDDPGCLVQLLDETRPQVHAVYFRHLHEQRWVPLEQSGFVAVTPTPMGFGHGAVDSGAAGAIAWDAFRAKVKARLEAMR